MEGFVLKPLNQCFNGDILKKIYSNLSRKPLQKPVSSAVSTAHFVPSLDDVMQVKERVFMEF